MMKSCKLKAVSAKLRGTSIGRRAAVGLALRAYRLKPAAFSLIEVVAAVAIFAIGLVALLGLLTPITKSVANVEDTEAAALVADAVRARMQTLAAQDFTKATALVQDAAAVAKNDASGSYNPNDGTKNPAVIFAKLNGEVGIYDVTGKTWYYYDAAGSRQPMNNADKYFEVELIRNDALSPNLSSADPPAAPQNLLAYTMRVRWPSFLPAAGGTAVQVGANPAGGAVTFDHSKKQVLFFPGTVMR